MNLQTLLLWALILLVIKSSSAQNQQVMIEKKLEIAANQVSISYQQQGEGKISLVFLHGWCINSQYWNKQLEHFSPNYSVYALDLPGFGKSTANRENWTIEAYAKDVAAFIKELELEQVILIAHSMSGAIMLQTALDEPSIVQGLIGVDNFKFIDVEFPAEQMEEMTAFFPRLEHDFERAAPIYAENMLFHPSTPTQIKERIKQDFATTNPKIGFNSFMNLMQFSAHSAQKLEQLKHKLYLVNSDAIPTNTKGLEDHCTNGFEVKEVHATGHYPMVEKPEEFNQRLAEILVSIASD